MDKLIDSIYDSNLSIKKCIHQLKYYDIDQKEIIKDVKNIIIENYFDNLFSMNEVNGLDISEECMNKLKNIKKEDVVPVLEDIISIYENFNIKCINYNKSKQIKELEGDGYEWDI